MPLPPGARILVLSLAAVSATGCCDVLKSCDAAGSLKTAEAMDAYQTLASAFATAGFSPSAAPGDGGLMSLEPQTVAAAFPVVSQSARCAGGGTVTYTGSTSGSSSDVTMTMVDCTSTSITTGRVWKFSTNPSIRQSVTTNGNLASGSYSVAGVMSGAFLYTSQSASGTCPITVTTNVAVQQGKVSSTTTGSICGTNISM